MLHVQKLAKALINTDVKGSTASFACVWPYEQLRAIKQIEKITKVKPLRGLDGPMSYQERAPVYAKLLESIPHAGVHSCAPCYAALSYYPNDRKVYEKTLKVKGSGKLVSKFFKEQNSKPEYVVYMPKFFHGLGLVALNTKEYTTDWEKLTHNQKLIEQYYNIILKNWKWVTHNAVGQQSFRNHVEDGFILKCKGMTLQRLFAQGMIPRHFSEMTSKVLSVVPKLVKKGLTLEQAVMLSFAVQDVDHRGRVIPYRGGGHTFWHGDYATDEAYLSLLDGSYEPQWTQKKTWAETTQRYADFGLHKCTTHDVHMSGTHRSKFFSFDGEGWDKVGVLNLTALMKEHNER